MTRFADVRHLTSTESTNADVLALGRNGEVEGIVVVADVQTRGRGRQGRTWVAPPRSGLLCSVLLRPPSGIAELVTAMVAVAAHDAVTGLQATGVGIKWPNDLVVSVPDDQTVDDQSPRERKLAGILAEVDWSAGTNIADGNRPAGANERALVIAGLGLNVAEVAGLPVDVADRRIALEELVGHPVDLEVVLDSYLRALDHRYTELLERPDDLLTVWRERCVTLGARVRVDLAAGQIEGVAVDADERGRLMIETDEGTRSIVSAGDVVHLRRPH